MIMQVAAAAGGYGYGGRRRVWRKGRLARRSPLTEFGVVTAANVGLEGMLGGERGVYGVR
jgi:hypothetical protein